MFLILVPLASAGVVPKTNPGISDVANNYEWTLVATQNVSFAFSGIAMSGTCADVGWTGSGGSCDTISASSASYGNVGEVVSVSGVEAYRNNNYFNSMVDSDTWIVEFDAYFDYVNQFGVNLGNRSGTNAFQTPAFGVMWDAGGAAATRQVSKLNFTHDVTPTTTTNFTGASDGAWHTITHEYLGNATEGSMIYIDGQIAHLQHSDEKLATMGNLTATGMHIVAGGWTFSSTTRIGNVTVYKGTLLESVRPNVTQLTLTSGVTVLDDSEPYETNDTTPTFTFNTNIDSNCRIGRLDMNYTDLGASRQCTGGEGDTEHTCTVIADDAVPPTSFPYHKFAVSCVNKYGVPNESTSSTSGLKDVNVLGNEILNSTKPVNGQRTYNNNISVGNRSQATTVYIYINGSFNSTFFGDNGYVKGLEGDVVDVAMNLSQFYEGNWSHNHSLTFTFNSSKEDLVVDLYFNGQNAINDYETGTTANFSLLGINSGQVCYLTNDVLYSLTCTEETTYPLLLIGLSYSNFSDGSSRQVLSSGESFGYTVDNRTDLFNLTVRINSTDAEDVVLANSSVHLASFPGMLRGDVNIQTKGVYDGVASSIFNISFPSAGIKTFTINYSAHRPLSLIFSNLSFNITGFNVDEGNSVEFEERFNTSGDPGSYNSTGSVNYTNGFGSLVVWDDFDVNRSDEGRWVADGTTCGTDEGFVQYVQNTFSGKTFNNTNLLCGVTTTTIAQMKAWETEFDLRNVSHINASVFYNLICDTTGTGAKGLSTGQLIVTDGTNSQFFHEQSISNCNPSANVNYWRNYELIRQGGTNIWDVYVDGAFSSSKSITIPSDQPWRLGIRSYASTSNDAGANAHTKVYLDQVMIGGISANATGGAGEKSPFVSYQSLLINKSSSDITAATLNSIDVTSPGFDVDVTYELTNDLQTWKEAVSGQRLVFDTSGSQLAFRVNCSSSVKNQSCFIPYVGVEVVEGSVSNLTFDFGSDGVTDFAFDGYVNQTNGSLNVNNLSLVISSYILDNCGSALTCLVPVTIASDSSGVLQVHEINASLVVSYVSLNHSVVEDNTTFTYNVLSSSGSVEVREPVLSFRGFGYFNVTGAFLGNESHNPANSTKTLNVHYSNYLVNFPPGVSYLAFNNIQSRTQKNVTPYGQSSVNPIRNFTGKSPWGSFNLSVIENTTHIQGLNLSAGNVSDVKQFVINSSPQQFCKIDEYGDACGLWLWLDLNLTSGGLRLPVLSSVSICSECIKTSDWTQNRLERVS